MTQTPKRKILKDKQAYFYLISQLGVVSIYYYGILVKHNPYPHFALILYLYIPLMGLDWKRTPKKIRTGLAVIGCAYVIYPILALSQGIFSPLQTLLFEGCLITIFLYSLYSQQKEEKQSDQRK